MWMDVDTALSEVPVNVMPLIDDTDFKTRETAVAYNASGMDLVWNFVTTAGAYTQTAVTPTTSGTYDWAHQGDGMYSIEVPASGGASINNDTEGFGWFSGVATGVLPWRGPIIGFRAAALNNLLIDDAFSTTRGLAGTALPNAAADAAGGLPVSDAGGLDLDAKIGALTYGTANRVNVQVYGVEANAITAAAIANGAIDAATFAADVDAEILSYIVDDATRLDGSAVNTLSSHDPGETIMGATDLGTGSALTSLAPSATALSTVQWTNTRAGHLDNLNVGGNVASSAEVTSIQNNTRVVRVTPDSIELPTAGTRTYRIELFLYDDVGNMETPDSAPTIALVNQSGTDRSSRLDSTTMSLVETGRYRAIYTSTAGDTKEQLVWTFSVVEGGSTRKYGNTSYVTDAVATDFTTADRAKLDTLHDSRLTSARAGYLDNLSAGAVATAANLTTLTNYVDTEIAAILEDTDTTIPALITARTIVSANYATSSALQTVDDTADAIKIKTDLIPASPAAVGSEMNLANNAITDAKISAPAETAGRPTGMLAMLRRVFERIAGGNKSTRDRNTGTVTLRNAADDGTLETHTQSTSGNVDTQTKGA